MFDARMRTTLAQRLVSIVLSVFDQTCFNRLTTHFNINIFGHQTMFDGVWSSNISRLSRKRNIYPPVISLVFHTTLVITRDEEDMK